ncbi:MAG: CRISPR-associated helicase Cas3', partial [Chloroflexi bacterium]|nr:CRISPR-associated helicase Cas3' [Chloroflexota bacterium]
MTEILPFLQLWGKIDAQGKVHPLVCHLIDVSQVALAIWENVLTKSARAHMARALGLSDMGEAGLLFAYWAGLHDLGKASPSFQGNPRRVSSEIREDAKTRLKAFGFDFPQVVGQVCSHHGSITTRTLPDLLVERTGLSAELARLVASSVGGHHGVWPTDHELYLHAGPRAIGKGLWDDARRWLVARLDELMNSPRVPEQVKVGPTANTLMTALSGLTSVADWVGSMEAYFQTGDRSADLASEDLVGYAEVSRVNALRALDETGWLCRQPPALSCSFQDLFKIAAPYPLQQSIIELAPTLDRPCLVIIEAPTGIGKTEAALYLADNWTRSQSRTGLYVAMPTMATSDQMYGRVKEFLLRRYPGSLSNYHLLHGNAALRDDDQVPRLSVVEDGVDHKGTVAALEWFTARKRGLLAPFAVGTVDQSLMGVLQTPHFFVRLFGLAHKTIVFDEVHAYDTYMDELLRLLLRWLRALDASVIILSATLPEKTRRSLVEAYSGNASLAIQNANYPRITWAMEDKTDSVSLPSPPERTIELAHIGRDPREITSFLSTKLSGGGCAAVICNTVARAQEVFQSIRDS